MEARNIALLGLAVSLFGCGTYTPGLQNFYETRAAARMRVSNLVDYLACDIKASVQEAIIDDEDLAPIRKANHLKPIALDWLKGYAAQITLTLTVDEKSTFNPGIAFNTVFPSATTNFAHHAPVITAQSFSLGLAGAFSTEATRKETLGFSLDFKDFTTPEQLAIARVNRLPGRHSPCNELPGGMVETDIKFNDWLSDVTLPAVVQGGTLNYTAALAAAQKALKKDVISHEVTFIVLYGGNGTPTWKLVRFSANATSLPFFGVQRTNTQDVIITIGPTQAGTLSTAAQNTILASQIGVAVANAIRTTQ